LARLSFSDDASGNLAQTVAFAFFGALASLRHLPHLAAKPAASRFPYRVKPECFIPKRHFCVTVSRKSQQKFGQGPAVNMLVVEVTEVAKGVWQVRTRQIAEEEGDSDWDALQRVADASVANALERMEVRELLQVLLARTPLAQRERQVLSAFLEGEDNFAEIAQRLGLTRSRVWDAFRSAVKKLRQTASALGIVP
jgi:DNA-binding CsgD family transcriptional regulator